MSAPARILVAGVGNLFYRDDAFGIEVARRLAAEPPPATKVADFGIRAIHLAYELLAPLELCVIADCMPRGGPPGSLYLVEPDLDETPTAITPTGLGSQGFAGLRPAVDLNPGLAIGDAHGMSLPFVFGAVRQLGGMMPRTLVVGCEPADVQPGIGLDPSVERAIPEAIGMIRELIAGEVSP